MALWHCGAMPTVDTVLLPLCVGLTLLGVIVTGVAWRRRRTGRVIQGLGLALAPLALYLTGLMRLLWDGVVAVTEWASQVILSPTIWTGFGLLALCLVLWVVGGVVARRTANRPAAKPVERSSAANRRAVAPSGRAQPQQQPPVDDDMAEIEALLKSRGIQ